MRAAAVALVLIVGAAVVLLLGNTLNSWVLGGLIGGLAALLLSIPISLTLFSYLARRHDEQLKAEAQEESFLAGSYKYPQSSVEAYETGTYLLPAVEEQWSEEDNYYQAPKARNLPVPSAYPRLPVARQNQLPASEDSIYRPHAADYQLAPERRRGEMPGVRSNGTPTPPRHPSSGRQVRYPGFPGYKPNSQRGSQQTAALRAARQEAIRQRQQYSDTEFFPGTGARKLPAARSEQHIVQQPLRPQTLRSSRPLSPQAQAPNQYRPKRTVEGSSVPPGTGRALPGAGETSADHTTESLRPRGHEPRTEQLHGGYRQTGPFRQSPTSPQTGQMVRRPQVDAQAQRRNPDVISGSLKNPLVRRAPYMYEDDPLRQELAQHLEAPPVRRSSRYEAYEDQED
jgi:hypothetical protein